MNTIYKMISAAFMLLCFATPSVAQRVDTLQIHASKQELNVENGVVSTANKSGFTIQSGNADFLLKPYALIQAQARVNWYDAEQLDASYQDHYANSGFAIPNAILGFSGRAFGRVTFNLALNAGQTGSALLQQAWFDMEFKRSLQLRAGKFKTPFNQQYLVTLGETLFPVLPSSLTTTVNTDKSLNAVNPTFATGFDLGVQLGGLLSKDRFAYQVGIFNGTGISVNSATKGQSDDLKIPALLYAGRVVYQPQGVMPTHQGRPDDLKNHKMLFALSSSINVDAESSSSNDWRTGAEFALLHHRWYFGAEAYMLHMDWTDRMQDADNLTYLGGYVQAGYFCMDRLQAVARWEVFDRNGLDTHGWLNMPAVGVNYFFPQYNVKLQAMYQYVGRNEHDTQYDRDTDDNGMAQHSGCIMLQYTF